MKKSLIVILFFTFTLKIPAQTGWVTQPTVVNYTLLKVEFVNSQTGFIVGNSNKILKTTNTGNSWFEISTVDSATEYRDIFFLNENTGYAAGGTAYNDPPLTFYFSSTLAKTTNSGNNWSVILRDTSQAFTYQGILGSVYFANALTGYAGGGLYGNSYNQLYKTTDGGSVWIPSRFSPLLGYPFALYFLSADTGLCAFPEGVIKTTDEGNNWSYTSVPFASYFFDIFFIDGQTGYASGGDLYHPGVGGKSVILKTFNAGANWGIVFSRSGLNYCDLSSIYFTDAHTGYAVGPTTLINNLDTISIILKTTDDGANWGFQQTNRVSLNSVYFINSLTGFAVGKDGTILKTTDGGGEVTSSINNLNNFSPDKFSLSQNYPNPFNPKTIINYKLGITNFVSLKVFNALGKEVATLVNEKQNAGSYAVDFNGEGLPSGVYFYKLEAGSLNGASDFVETKRMILLK